MTRPFVGKGADCPEEMSTDTDTPAHPPIGRDYSRCQDHKARTRGPGGGV